MQPSGQVVLPANPLSVFAPAPQVPQGASGPRPTPQLTDGAKAVLVVSNLAAWGLAVWVGSRAWKRARATCGR